AARIHHLINPGAAADHDPRVAETVDDQRLVRTRLSKQPRENGERKQDRQYRQTANQNCLVDTHTRGVLLLTPETGVHIARELVEETNVRDAFLVARHPHLYAFGDPAAAFR